VQVETTVTVKVTDTRGEVYEVSRALVSRFGDNPHFIDRHVKNEIAGASGSVQSSIVSMFGESPQE
jgi:hypothetical protein